MRTPTALHWLPLGLVVAFAVGCSSGDDTAAVGELSTTTTTTTEVQPTDADESSDSLPDDPDDTPAPELSGPAPGITDDSIKIGINYVDTEALLAVGLEFDLGDHRSVYQALIDDINDGGGIHGRLLDPIYAAINPTNNESADSVCLQLTEDEDVFLITGFFLLDTVLCPVDLHETAVVGGSISPERVAQAKAPWAAWLPDTDQPKAVVETLHAQGKLDGSVAVYAADSDQSDLDNHVLPTLEALGVDVVAIGVMDAPTDDTAAIDARVQLIAERFSAEGADTVVLVGASSATWPQYLSDDPSYRPQLLFLSSSAVNAFATTGTTTDTSILDGALSGGGYGPDQARFDEAEMQSCIATLTERGLDTPSPADFDADDQSNQPFQAALQACPDMALTVAALQAAGENLNYATLEAALDGLVVAIPGDPAPRTYGPASSGAGDGDPVAYLFEWDPARQTLVLAGN
ncbi:MAG: hypothetical protein P8J50_18670 [Acidimicrobiales bacterium]|nr:hypothetical protein [Acidimicrobiales bacterium]